MSCGGIEGGVESKAVVIGCEATAGINEMQVAVALNQIDLVWDQLFPLEQYRIVQLLVDRTIVSPNELQVKLHPNRVENLALDVIRDPNLRRTAETAQT